MCSQKSHESYQSGVINGHGGQISEGLLYCVGIVERYEDGSWKVEEERLKLGKTEGQVWLTLYKLLLDKDCQQKYDFTSAKKSAILQVRTMVQRLAAQFCSLQYSLEQSVKPLNCGAGGGGG